MAVSRKVKTKSKARPQKGKTARAVKTQQVAELEREQLLQMCLSLRKRGQSHRDIAASIIEIMREGDEARGIEPQPKFSISYKTVGNYIRDALVELAAQNNEEAEQLRTLELEHLNYLRESLAPLVDNGDVSAINAAVRVSESRRRLLGIDEPEKHQVTSVAQISCVEVVKPHGV